MTITLGIDNVCYNHTMRAGSLDVAGFLDKAVTYGAKAVQMDPLWPSQGLDLSDESLARLASAGRISWETAKRFAKDPTGLSDYVGPTHSR